MAKIKLISEVEELRFQRDAVVEAADTLEAQRDAALAQLAAVTQQRDAAVAALLLYPEWVKGLFTYYCPVCDNNQDDGHAPDCKRQATLAQVRE